MAIITLKVCGRNLYDNSQQKQKDVLKNSYMVAKLRTHIVTEKATPAPKKEGHSKKSTEKIKMKH